MDVITALAAAKAALDLASMLLDEEEHAKWARALAQLEAKSPQLDALMEFIRDLTARISAGADLEHAKWARAQNPAFKKPSPGAIGAAGLCLLVALLLSSCCKGSIVELAETDEYRAGYTVTWPADVDPEGFQTIQRPETGLWVTSVPKADATAPSAPQ